MLFLFVMLHFILCMATGMVTNPPITFLHAQTVAQIPEVVTSQALSGLLRTL